MRTIGRKYKNQIVRLAAEAKAHGEHNAVGIVCYVRRLLSAKAWDTWEMADQEIERLASDEAFKV